MALVNVGDMLARARREGYAVGAFNFFDYATLAAVVEAAAAAASPAILQTLPPVVGRFGTSSIAAWARELAGRYPRVPLALHLDHGSDLGMLEQAIRDGYTSVMFDGSTLPFEENVAKTRQVVAWAKKKGVSVEAEIGAIKGVEDLVSVSEKEAFFTDPEEAVKFVKMTGCDSLAISIGTAHGAFKSKTAPELDIERLKKIDALVRIPLVLHGASGISPEMLAKAKEHCDLLQDCDRLRGAVGVSDEDIKRAIRHGIRKINIDSDLRIAFTAGLRDAIIGNLKAIDPRVLLAPSKKLMKEVVRHKMELFGSQGRAGKR